MNRRSGGVGGAASRDVPLSRFRQPIAAVMLAQGEPLPDMLNNLPRNDSQGSARCLSQRQVGSASIFQVTADAPGIAMHSSQPMVKGTCSGKSVRTERRPAEPIADTVSQT